MRIRVLKICESLSEVSVFFDSDVGSACGQWHGVLPALNDVLDVELEIPSVLEWGKGIVSTSETIGSIAQADDGVTISGNLEAVEGSVALVRIGKDILHVEYFGVCESGVGGATIKVPVLHLYDANL